MTRHLSTGEHCWCSNDLKGCDDYVEDPREANCQDCLKRAAGYGAAAAMRSAAVEAAAAQRDPQLEKERDAAIEELLHLQKMLVKEHLYQCRECKNIISANQVADLINSYPPIVTCDVCVDERADEQHE